MTGWEDERWNQVQGGRRLQWEDFNQPSNNFNEVTAGPSWGSFWEWARWDYWHQVSAYRSAARSTDGAASAAGGDASAPAAAPGVSLFDAMPNGAATFWGDLLADWNAEHPQLAAVAPTLLAPDTSAARVSFSWHLPLGWGHACLICAMICQVGSLATFLVSSRWLPASS